jgi:hypothetical protein
MSDALARYQVGDEVNGHVLTSWHEWIAVEDAVELVATQGYRAGVSLVGERFVQSHQQLIAGAWHAARRAHDRAVAAAAAQLGGDELTEDAVPDVADADSSVATTALAQEPEFEHRLARIEALLERIADRIAPSCIPAPCLSSAPAPAPDKQVRDLASPA